nr:MFS transporter [Chloroflexaceae bacterium]
MQSSRFFRVGLAFLAFISLGLPDGLLGVGWPSIRASFGLPLEALGALLLTVMTGYLLSSFSSGWVLRHMGVGTLLTLSCLVAAASLLGYAVAPLWAVMVALGVLAGLGGGAIDAGLNSYAATYHSARTMNWLHACYGIGATLGPLLMTAVLTRGLPWQTAYATVGGGLLLLAGCFALTRTWWQVPTSAAAAEAATPQAPFAATLRLPAAWLGIVLFFCYTGVEAAAGQWSYSLLTQSRGVAEDVAGVWVSVYWGTFTAGRIIFGLIATRFPLRLMLRLCLLLALLGAALISLNLADGLTFAGLALLGLALAPLFPSLIATTPERV